MRRALLGLDDVQDVHDLRLDSTSGVNALSVHLAADPQSSGRHSDASAALRDARIQKSRT